MRDGVRGIRMPLTHTVYHVDFDNRSDIPVSYLPVEFGPFGMIFFFQVPSS